MTTSDIPKYLHSTSMHRLNTPGIWPLKGSLLAKLYVQFSSQFLTIFSRQLLLTYLSLKMVNRRFEKTMVVNAFLLLKFIHAKYFKSEELADRCCWEGYILSSLSFTVTMNNMSHWLYQHVKLITEEIESRRKFKISQENSLYWP